MKAESLSEQLFFNTVRISAEGGPGTWSGTGFVMAVETSTGTAQFVVTNKHVLDGASQVTLSFIRADGDEPALGLASSPTLSEFGPDHWAGHPDPEIDVAIIPIARVIDAMVQRQLPMFFKAITPELAYEPTDDLDALESVTFIGYPSGLFDSVSLLPIARRGSTATPISVDYEGKPVFLIDASVFPGSSGSPVFVLDRGTYAGRDGNVTVGTRVIFVGVLAAVQTRQVQGHLEIVRTSLPAPVFQEPIDLGIVFKASCVLETIDMLLGRHGLTRVQSSTPMVDGAPPSEADEAIGES